MKTLKAVLKMLCALLYESNSEAVWINKRLKTWCKNRVWVAYWTCCEKIAVANAEVFGKLAA